MATRRIGKPVGSTNGRRPPGGYPRVSPELGSFLAGFLDGEASFGISRQTGRTNFRCTMSLGARDDDSELLQDLAGSTALGTIAAKPGRAGSKSQVVWCVAAKSDCARLVEILEKYPLRGRKSRDFAIWDAAVRWWIADDPRHTYPNRDKSAIVYLKGRLQEARKLSREEAERVIQDDCEGLTADWPGYVAGLLTAEGSLGILQNSPGILQPRSHLRMRSDDRPLLQQVAERTGAGRIYDQRPSSSYPPGVANWIVCSRDDLSRLVNMLDRHPPRGRKRREYDIWREAVLEYAKGEAPRVRHGRLSELRSALAEARTYRPSG